MPATTDFLQNARRLVPISRLPKLIERRLDGLWVDEDFRAEREEQMRFLLEFTPRAPEIPELARGYAEQSMLRKWLRYRPAAITKQRVEGIEWLTSRRDTSRPMILSFMHHHRYDGMFASLKRHGADLHILMLAEVLAKDAPEPVRQHCRVVRRGGTIQSTEGGTAAILEILKPGVTLAIASDVASQTEVEFLGRRVRGAFGAARIAAQTNSPVVIVTSVRDGDDVLNGHYLKVHEPLEPADFAGPEELLNELLAVHGEAILAWPEAHDIPLARFMPIEDGDTGSV